MTMKMPIFWMFVAGINLYSCTSFAQRNGPRKPEDENLKLPTSLKDKMMQAGNRFYQQTLSFPSSLTNSSTDTLSSERAPLPELDGNTDVKRSFVGKHADNITTTCYSYVNWRDLGPLSYPRLVKETLCRFHGAACLSRHHQCTQSHYPVYILSATSSELDYDTRVPYPLRQNWKFSVVNVSVGCMCSEIHV